MLPIALVAYLILFIAVGVMFLFFLAPVGAFYPSLCTVHSERRSLRVRRAGGRVEFHSVRPAFLCCGAAVYYLRGRVGLLFPAGSGVRKIEPTAKSRISAATSTNGFLFGNAAHTRRKRKIQGIEHSRGKYRADGKGRIEK